MTATTNRIGEARPSLSHTNKEEINSVKNCTTVRFIQEELSAEIDNYLAKHKDRKANPARYKKNKATINANRLKRLQRAWMDAILVAKEGRGVVRW